jgi:hypothetical protein
MPRCGATRRDNVIGRPEGPRRLSGALPSGFHFVGSDVVGGMPLESELLTLHEDTRTVIDRLWQGDTGSEFHGAFTLCTVFRKHGVFHYTSFAFSGRRCNLLIFFLYMHVLYAPDAQIVPVSGIHLVCIPTVTALEVVDSFGRELSVRQWSRGGITRIYFLAPRLPSFPCGERRPPIQTSLTTPTWSSTTFKTITLQCSITPPLWSRKITYRALRHGVTREVSAARRGIRVSPRHSTNLLFIG